MDLLGIGCGFLAAGFQSLSYLSSRWFLQRSGGKPLQLLGISHLLMGAVAVLLFPVLTAGVAMPPLAVYFGRGVGAIGFYMIAQAGLFMALKRVDSSRIAPLLGLKIFFLALISAAFLGASLNGWQWVAVGLSVAAVFLLNGKGVRLSPAAAGAIAVAVIGYCLSDLFIKQLVVALAPAGPRAALIAVCVTYIMGAVVGLPLALRASSRSPRLWVMAAPYAAAWFISMLFLYVTFDRIGVVFGNIIQSTRGLMSIGLGVLVGRQLGMVDLEGRVPRRLLVLRVIGATLMTAAIFLYLRK
jgi:drug/metabolite transporter (DMT)-like permease